MREDTLVEIIQGNKVLLKKATRGISTGKWNGLGGKIEADETEIDSAVRECFEESGLKVRNLMKHGANLFFRGNSLMAIVHLYSTRDFEGELKASDEGELRWFEFDRVPFKEMWPDDEYWMPLLLAGKKFEARFFFSDDMKKVVRYEIDIKD